MPIATMRMRIPVSLLVPESLLVLLPGVLGDCVVSVGGTVVGTVGGGVGRSVGGGVGGGVGGLVGELVGGLVGGLVGELVGGLVGRRVVVPGVVSSASQAAEHAPSVHSFMVLSPKAAREAEEDGNTCAAGVSARTPVRDIERQYPDPTTCIV